MNSKMTYFPIECGKNKIDLNKNHYEKAHTTQSFDHSKTLKFIPAELTINLAIFSFIFFLMVRGALHAASIPNIQGVRWKTRFSVAI